MYRPVPFTRVGGLTATLLLLGASLAPLPAKVHRAAKPAQDDQQSDAELRTRVERILKQVPFFDGHNDVPWQYRSRVDNHMERLDFSDTSRLNPPMHTDLPRLKKSGIGAQFWSVYTPTDYSGPGSTTKVLEQIDIVHRLVERHPGELEMAYTASDVVRIHAQGRVASLIGMEGGHAIENSLGALRQLYRAGARYMTLTHSANTDWADSATDKAQHGGLSEFGSEVVREMNRLGMLVDLSHVSAKTMHAVLDIASAPVIFSHSSAFAKTAHLRNVPDDVLHRLPQNGGVVMVTFVPSFVSEAARRHGERESRERRRLRDELSAEEADLRLETWRAEHPAPRARLADIADHIDHIKNLIGTRHIGIGSDFDGISNVPEGLEDVAAMPELLIELLRRGYTDQQLREITGLNLLRVMRSAEAAAWSLQASGFASDASLADRATEEPQH